MLPGNEFALSFLSPRMFHSQWCRLQGNAELDGTARREAMPVLERDLPASVQHSEIPQRGGGPGRAQLLQVRRGRTVLKKRSLWSPLSVFSNLAHN